MLISTAATPQKIKKQYKKDCSLCGRQGHKAIDCFSRPENAHKRSSSRPTTSKSLPNSPIRAIIAFQDSFKICTYFKMLDHTDAFFGKNKEKIELN